MVGAWQVCEPLLKHMLQHPYLSLPAPKTTGREVSSCRRLSSTAHHVSPLNNFRGSNVDGRVWLGTGVCSSTHDLCSKSGRLWARHGMALRRKTL